MRVVVTVNEIKLLHFLIRTRSTLPCNPIKVFCAHDLPLTCHVHKTEMDRLRKLLLLYRFDRRILFRLYWRRMLITFQQLLALFEIRNRYIIMSEISKYKLKKNTHLLHACSIDISHLDNICAG